MASASASDEAAWHEGDLCLAPRSHDGILTEATIHRLTSSSHDNDTAWVIFTEGEEQEEEAVPVRKLLRPGLNQLCQEKPVFPGSSIQPSLCIPLNLSDEDRVPYTINRYLRDYQREGISFIYNNYINSTGCILGDDMGLGKTVQVIGFLAAVLHKTGTWEDIEKNRPQFLQSQISSEQSVPSKVFLIVAPLSVLYNWKDELDTWGNFHCVVVHGLRKEEELARIKKGRTEIALTTYETLRLCLDQFNKVDWSAVFVDEAHKIKNPNSQITQAMKALRCKIRIGLTGTILQNNLEELWCVMDWAVPGCLGSLGHFKNHFSDPIEQGQRHSATKRSLATARKTVHALMRKISHLFLRRTKALIQKQLPKKDDRVVYCSLTDFQQEVYRAVLDCEDVTLLLRSSEKCDCQSGRTRTSCCYKKNSEGVLIKELYFSYLTILRKVANHAALLQSTQSTSKKQEKYVSAVCAKVFHKFPEFVERCRTEAFEALSDPVYSGKMRVLQKLLKYYLQRRDKVLIFSLSTKLLDVLERYCMAEGLDYSRLDGSTKSKERVQIVKDFNSSSHINLCLVSTMAGGLGLNFVGANVVVLFDPTWNPANDLQAIDRAYRIGQCRDVTVLRLISLGTVEEVIYLRQVYKQQLQSSVVGKESARRYFEAVQGSDAYNGELFGIPNLFRLQTEGTCLTRRILEREGRIEAGVMTTRTQRGSEEEEEETKRDSEPGGPLLHAEAAKTNGDSSQVSRDVLDFSSGSETDDEEVQKLKRKASNQRRDGDGNSGKVNTSRGWMSLLQHGFSRLLERVSKRAELEEVDSSSCAEESPSEEDAAADDQKIDQTSPGLSKPSSAGNCVLFPLKSGIITQDGSSGSDKKHDDNGEKIFLSKEEDVAVRRRWTQKRCKDKQTAVDDTSDRDSSPDNKKAHKLQTSVPKVKNFDSDESDDFNLETTTGSKKYDLNCYKKGRDRGKGTSHKGRKHRVCGKNKSRSRYTENIETFTSSEDELTPSTGRGEEMGKKASFTNLKKQRSPSSNETKRTIDCVLGDVHEVVYTHSNQRVVGGSKAEELISRAAVRDVFERKIHSQFPANHLPVTQESLPTSLPDSHPHSTSVKLQKHNEDHPVTFTSKSLHHTGCTTVIIGETPKAIRRQQLEEMAAKFQFPSVRQFATEILKRNSPLRLSWLRQYYTSLSSSDVAETVTENFPEPDSAQTATSAPSAKTAAKNHHADNTKQQKESSRTPNSVKYTQRNPKPQTKPDSPQNNVSLPQIRSGNLQNDVPQPPKKQKILRKNVQDPLWDDPGPESDKQEEMVCSARGRMSTKKSSVSNPGAHRAGGGLGVDRASCSGLGSGEAAAFLNRTDRYIPSSSSDLGCRSSAVSSKSAAQETEQEQKSQPRTSETSQRWSENAHPPSTYNRSLLIDLIGDTSILDDLLKAKPKKTQQNTPTSPSTSSLSVNTSHVTSPSSNRTFSNLKEPASHRVSEPVQAAKSGRRDIWDILNEGNEESINKLTDPKELQRVCVDSSSAVRRVSEQRETKSLWKTNDKFLWKK